MNGRHSDNDRERDSADNRDDGLATEKQTSPEETLSWLPEPEPTEGEAPAP